MIVEYLRYVIPDGEGAAFEEAYARAAQVLARAPEHVRDEHSTFHWLLEVMIARAGFVVEEAQHSHDGMFARYLLRAPA